MLLGVVAQAQNFAITATTEAAVRKNIVKGNAANYGFGMINDTLKLIGLTTRNVIFTGTIGKSGVGLGNVDNTSDANKPVSTATQTALNLKANIASPTFTGTVSGITKSMVGLGNVDNTTDAAKPISTATQTALDAKQATLNGTGFVKVSGTTISYDNSTYLSTSTAASTYLPISNPTATGTLTAPTIANSLGANFATTSGNVGIGTTAPTAKLELSGTGTVSSRITSTNSTAQLITSGTLGQIYNTTGDLYLTNASTTNSTLFVNNGAERMRIFANGRVGIGTTTDAGFLLDVNGITRLNGNVSIGTANNARTLSVQTTSNDVNIEGINSRTTGNNYAITGNSNGIGASLNMGGFFQASGATSNHGLRIYNVAATANNYSL